MFVLCRAQVELLSGSSHCQEPPIFLEVERERHDIVPRKFFARVNGNKRLEN